MAAHHPLPASDIDSSAADSVASTPRYDLHDDSAIAPTLRVRFMCSFGGKILPRPHDNQLRYFGGDTRIVAVNRQTTFSALLSKLAKLSGTTNISIKYQLPNEDLDALITVTADEDVENMMEEYDRLSQSQNQSQKSVRLRLFLFPIENNDSSSRATSINSLLDGSIKRENWFFDVLNGGSTAGSVLERGRSEVSSIVSEVPDYLFGLDNNLDDTLRESTKFKNKNLPNDNVSMSDPGSPAPVASSPFCSTSSSLAPPNLHSIPDLPPVKTKPVNPVQMRDTEMVNEKIPPQQTGYSGGPGPVWHYPNQAVQPVPTMYYMQGNHVQATNASVPMRTQYLQSYPVSSGQVPMGFPGMNHMYGAGMRPYEVPTRYITDNSGQAVYYGARNMAVVQGSYPGLVVPGVEEAHGPGSDSIPGRVSQG